MPPRTAKKAPAKAATKRPPAKRTATPRKSRAKATGPDGAPRWMEYLPVAALPELPRNAKDHELAGIGQAMGRFGYLEPVVIDERTGRLVSGHGRKGSLLGAIAAGDPPPEGIVVDATGAWLVPVTRGWRSKNDAEAEAAAIAINRHTEAGGWKDDVLSAVLADLAAGPGLVGVGYTGGELDDLLAGLGDSVVLPPAPTDAGYAEHVGRGEPADPRSVQGLREVGLMFTAEDHREYLELLAKLKRVYSEDAAPPVVLRAMRAAAELAP